MFIRKIIFIVFFEYIDCHLMNIKVSLLNMKFTRNSRVSVQGVESFWGDCGFIPAEAYCYDRGCFFSPELVRDHTKIQRFWKKNWKKILKKNWKKNFEKKYFEIFFFWIFFHILECNSFSPELVRDHTKIQGFWKKNWEKKIEIFFWIFFHILGCHSFSPELVLDHTKIQGFEKKIEKKNF